MGNLSVENVWHDYWDYISQQNIGLFHKKIKKFYKKGRYADLSIILGLMVTIVAFLIKTAEYVRLYLVFSMYKIDGSYVEVDDKALFKAIGILEAVIIYFLINFVICFVRLNNSRVKRTIIMILIYGGELTSIYMFAFSLVRMPVASLKGMAIKDVIWLLFLALLLVLMCIPLNKLGAGAAEYVLAKQSDRIPEKIETGKEIKIVLLCLFILLCVYPFAFLVHESNRTNYKIISAQTEFTDNEYIFEDSASGEKRLIYVVVYENEDYYFTCLLKHDFASKSVYIDTSATKQYNKSNNDILTQYFSDINYFSRNDIELVR